MSKLTLPKRSLRYYAKTYFGITVGALIFAFSLSFFFGVFEIPAGGVSGISLLINHFFPNWDTGILYLVINIPILVLGLFTLGLEFSISTVYATVACSLFTALFDYLRAKFNIVFTNEIVVGTIAAGGLMGAGLGIIFRMRASSGGSDIIVKLLRRKFRHIKTGIISMCIDVCIITLSCLIREELEMWLFGILELIAMTIVFDYVLYANNAAKLTYIVTTDDDATKKIVDRIMIELDTGATLIDGKGAYTGNDKKVILCACKPVLFPRLRDIVSQEDKHAFLIVSSAQEIYGENFKEDTEDL